VATSGTGVTATATVAVSRTPPELTVYVNVVGVAGVLL